MSTYPSPLFIKIQDFLTRFRNSKKLDDLFSRGYTQCIDTYTNKRSILKFYSIQTTQQQQAVLQNMNNFEKLNQIQGICKLLAYTIAQTKTQLISAFQYDVQTLNQKIQKIIEEPIMNGNKQDRIRLYLGILEEMCKIISISIEIGIQIDDINKYNILIKQKQPPSQQISSLSSIKQSINIKKYQLKILYDQRQKQYNKILQPNISNISNINNINNKNKLYWSPQKIQNQILKLKDYSTQQGQQSIYQLGLMLLDLIYDVQKSQSNKLKIQNIHKGNYQQQFKPDQIVALSSSNNIGYYNINKQTKNVQRNQILITHRLNYIMNIDAGKDGDRDRGNGGIESMKKFGILLKSMINLMSQTRPDINKIIIQKGKILEILEKEVKSNNINNSYNGNNININGNINNNINGKNNINTNNSNSNKQILSSHSISSPQKLRQIRNNNYNSNDQYQFNSLQSVTEQPIHILSSNQIIKNIGASGVGNMSGSNSNNYISSTQQIHYDSLKYSQNSVQNQNQNFKKSNVNSNTQNNVKNNSPSPISYRKQQQINPLSSQTNNTDTNIHISTGYAGYTGYNNNNMSQNYNQSQNNISPVKISTQINQSQNVNNLINTNQKLLNKLLTQSTSSQQNTLNITQIMNNCKNHHQTLKNSLYKALIQLNQIKKVHPQKIQIKKYFDSSIYYGNIDQTTKKRLGLGIYIYKTGDIYFGIWKDNILINGIYLFKNNQSFQGIVKNGKQGYGTYRYLNGNVYNGEWKNDLKHGKGIMLYPNGAKYDGQWEKGKKHGYGEYYYQNGIVYKGGFALGKKYGNGIFIFVNGTRVEGFWQKNYIQGLAKIYYENGDYFQGNLHMSEKNGQGVYRWGNGQNQNINGIKQQQAQIQYKGQFKKDNLDGYAIIKFKNGQIYEGKIKNGKRNGTGIYKYNNGDQFKGQWKNDQKQMGKYIFKNNGCQFQGKFKQGQMIFGTMYYSNNQIYQGEFKNGYRHGVGTYSNKTGQLVYEGHWEKDQFIGSKNV